MQPQQVGYPFIQPSGRKLPSHAQPGNCELNMTPEDFRTWRTTISMWLGLSRVPDDEGVILIRMYCTPPLQKALDNKIACEEWQRLAPAQAIDLLESITVKYTSRAADIGAFYNLKQGPYETIAAYFTRGHEVATSAKLRCPTCSQGLGNYLLLSKLAIGLHNEELRREAFRAFDTLKDVAYVHSALHTRQHLQRQQAGRISPVQNWREAGYKHRRPPASQMTSQTTARMTS